MTDALDTDAPVTDAPDTDALRLVFAGSPAAAVPSLRALAAGRHPIAAVLTREDSPQGRRRILTPTPVARAAEELGLRVIRADRLAPVTDELIALDADLGVVVAYGALIREPLLSAPRLGWINLHFSLLPRWRGAAPVQRAIIAGDDRTGSSVFRLEPELDAGPILGVELQAVGRHSTAGQLLDSLATSGAGLLTRVVDALADGTAVADEQQGAPTFAPKLTIEDGRIDWTRPAAEIAARIRGVTPEPGAFTEVGGDRVKILAAAPATGLAPLRAGVVESRGGRVVAGTADVPLELIEVQPAGRRAMPAADWLRGRTGRETVAG
ncbi:MAG: methionyl-tRNA formyltransferase [Micrococcales bacterium]|nr:methionyl-tRNA formyltransferase [Micrococcales bacterium]